MKNSKPTIWYLTSTTRPYIEDVEVLSFTDATVTLKEGREKRSGKFGSYFPTKQEAYQHLENTFLERVNKAEEKLRIAKHSLRSFKYTMELSEKADLSNRMIRHFESLLLDIVKDKEKKKLFENHRDKVLFLLCNCPSSKVHFFDLYPHLDVPSERVDRYKSDATEYWNTEGVGYYLELKKSHS